MTRRPRPIIGAAVAVVALALAGCSAEGEPEAEETTASTEPAVTAPPAATPEEQAEAEIEATFESLIADWDTYKSNASEYGDNGDDTWNADLVSDWPVEAQANLELTNWVAAWRRTEIEQGGASIVADHHVAAVQLDVTDDGLHQATSMACLDLTELTYATYDGQIADLSYEPDRFQTWNMTWIYHAQAAVDGGYDSGWYVQAIDLTRNAPC